MIPAILLMVAVVIYRVALASPGSVEAGWWQNFSPLASIALCGAALLPRRLALLLPLGALFLSDLFVNLRYSVPLLSWFMVPQYLALLAAAWLGWAQRGRVTWLRMMAASLLGSVLFYVITNTGAWAVEPRYAHSLAGWWQALTVGLPGYSPTLLFFRNTVASDLIFTTLFCACMFLQPAELGMRESKTSAA